MGACAARSVMNKMKVCQRASPKRSSSSQPAAHVGRPLLGTGPPPAGRCASNSAPPGRATDSPAQLRRRRRRPRAGVASQLVLPTHCAAMTTDDRRAPWTPEYSPPAVARAGGATLCARHLLTGATAIATTSTLLSSFIIVLVTWR
jgi:hypothetical protein